MNTQQKQKILKSYLQSLSTTSQSLHKQSQSLDTSQFNSYTAPKIDLVSQLLSHQKSISDTVDNTYANVQDVVRELSELQTKKENVTKLLDAMTAIKEVRRLSFGVGTQVGEVYRNLAGYYQIKGKVYYCDKYIDKVEEHINSIQETFQTELQTQLKKTNSDNISQIAKTLSLISQNKAESPGLKKSGSGQTDQITKFYLDLVAKQLKICQQDLFKIPITASNNSTSNCYIFFDIAKDVMKAVANLIKNYKGNILKIGGQQGLQNVIGEVFAQIMTGIMLEIFMREKKYFEFQYIDVKKLPKDQQSITKFKDYLNQFSAIWNQIQRLKLHLVSQLPQSSPIHRQLQNTLSNQTNTKELISINLQTSQAIKVYVRLQFNNLLKISPFVNSLFASDSEFLGNVIKGSKSYYEPPEAVDFVVGTFEVMMKPLEKVFQSLNMLIISHFITFANNNLVQEDSFHAFNELFSKNFNKLPSIQIKYNTAIVLLFNTILLMPGALKTQIAKHTIPAQLQLHQVRLQNELKQLVQVCDYKGRQVVNNFIHTITSAAWLATQLRQDYKKALDRWKGLAPEMSQLFFLKLSQLHCTIILADQFNVRNPKRVINQQGIIALEKEIRTIVNQYQTKGCSALSSFKKVLQYTQIMMAENEQNVNKLLKKFGIQDPQQVQKLNILRAMKID